MGKRDPRLALPLVEFVTEDTVIEIIRKTYKFIDKHIDKTLKKEFVGYIIDRVGFEKFKKEVLTGIIERVTSSPAQPDELPLYRGSSSYASGGPTP